MRVASDMSDRILDAAQMLVQTRGYDGFSYADIAERVGIRKASIHHHFPTKGDLGVRLVERFREECRKGFDRIDDSDDPRIRLRKYVCLFRETMTSRRLCLCGALSAGFLNLPESLRRSVIDAISEHETWLVGLIESGRSTGHFLPGPRASTLANAMFAGLEGAILIARVHADPSRFDDVATTLIVAIEAGSP